MYVLRQTILEYTGDARNKYLSRPEVKATLDRAFQVLEEAFELYCAAAHLDDVASYDNVGYMFRNGNGVRRNGEAAFAWASQGAHGGNARAMLLLADLHRLGQGTEKNLEKALEWFRKSASGGNDSAREYLPKFLAAHPELDR